jgi:hypothetical protein
LNLNGFSVSALEIRYLNEKQKCKTHNPIQVPATLFTECASIFNKPNQTKKLEILFKREEET